MHEQRPVQARTRTVRHTPTARICAQFGAFGAYTTQQVSPDPLFGGDVAFSSGHVCLARSTGSSTEHWRSESLAIFRLHCADFAEEAGPQGSQADPSDRFWFSNMGLDEVRAREREIADDH